MELRYVTNYELIFLGISMALAKGSNSVYVTVPPSYKMTMFGITRSFISTDTRNVVTTGIKPIINTFIAH